MLSICTDVNLESLHTRHMLYILVMHTPELLLLFFCIYNTRPLFFCYMLVLTWTLCIGAAVALDSYKIFSVHVFVIMSDLLAAHKPCLITCSALAATLSLPTSACPEGRSLVCVCS